MDGMLIFASPLIARSCEAHFNALKAGLFSVSLPAFRIESYQTLNIDSGDTTVALLRVALLRQISQQLAATSNGSSFSIPEPEVFVPPVASLICNALWFNSLGLSLSCALIATLLEQWVQDFSHRADMRSTPVVRARMFSFLYYGLKHFNMHVVAEVIPLLLHASLILFFAGLVAFLMPVNSVLGDISSVFLALVVVYCGLTILPLPSRLPLPDSTFCGSEGELGDNPLDSVVEAVFHAATKDSDVRTARDCRALVWTVKSLADDTELEPFVEGIYDVIWGPRGRRRLYDGYILALVSHRDVKLVTRIEALLRNADSGLLSKEAATRRRITCLRLSGPSRACQNGVPLVPAHSISTSYIVSLVRLPRIRDIMHGPPSRLHDGPTYAQWEAS
ncbi:hypothetical protein FB451DRAFT_1492092 [Mycena latifolia]|nr:hypothetical protein FB451DRAFT_1492092 [Mycena latifolia]